MFFRFVPFHRHDYSMNWPLQMHGKYVVNLSEQTALLSKAPKHALFPVISTLNLTGFVKRGVHPEMEEFTADVPRSSHYA
jgi:hypothetical protein